MGSWAVVVSGALMSLHVLGINLAPLLTVGKHPQSRLRICAYCLSIWECMEAV